MVPGTNALSAWRQRLSRLVLLSGQTKSLNPRAGLEPSGFGFAGADCGLAASGSFAGSAGTSGQSVTLNRDGLALAEARLEFDR